MSETAPNSSSRLLVPIHIDALLVGKKPKHFSWANLAPDYTKLKRDYFIGADLRSLFGAGKPRLGKGLHLHFRLPDALTHGSHDPGSNELSFPKIPNRWLVQRYYRLRNGKKTKLRVKAWIIRSDVACKKTGADAVSFPVFSNAHPRSEKSEILLEIRPTGTSDVIFDGKNSYPFEAGDTPAELELTAVGNGDAGFSGHYPACRSILGFYDDLKGIRENTKLTYVVTGWYSAVSDDPLHSFIEQQDENLGEKENLARMIEWMKDRQWMVDEPVSTDLPSRILCHGLVRGIHWRGKKIDYSDTEVFQDFDNQKKYSVDIGNSTAEALAARFATVAKQETAREPDLFEDVLTAFQTGLLSHGVSVSEMDAELHRQGFVPVVSGTRFVIQPEASSLDPADVAQPQEPLPQPLLKMLQNLNKYQQACDGFANMQKDYYWHLYALWHRWVQKRRSQKNAEAAILKSNLEGLKSFLHSYDNLPEVVAARKRRQAAEDLLRKALKAETSDGQNGSSPSARPKYRLSTTVSAPFYVPNDPVILLSGPALQRKGTYTQDGPLRCRITGQEVTGFTYDIPNGRHNNKVTAQECLAGLDIDADYLEAVPLFSRKLFSEAVLLEEISQREDTTHVIGRRPAPISVFDWEHNPWIPIYLTWEVAWQSDYGSGKLPETLIQDDWTLEGDGDGATGDRWKYCKSMDLVPRSEISHPNNSLRKYQGYSLLAQPSFTDLVERLRREPNKVSPRIRDIADKLQALLENRPMLAQSLGGFHEGLIMRRVGDQLPPLDYNRFAAQESGSRQFFVDPIAKAFRPEDQFDCSPSTLHPFYPIRAGRLGIRKLWIIDTFGQVIKIKPQSTQLLSARRLRTDFTRQHTSFQIRSRFVQPMRLTFLPAKAGNPETLAPATSPVCGWVIPNHLEQNLTLYAANGKPLGALQKKFELKAGSRQPFFYWVDVPGDNGGLVGKEKPAFHGDVVGDAKTLFNQHLEKKIENEHLREFARFVLGLSGDAAGAFSRLLDKALAAVEQRVPEEDPGVSVLIGRPLVLVRAKIQLEIHGLPAFDQGSSWQVNDTVSVEELLKTHGLEKIPGGKLKDVLTTGGIEKVRWPVRLGHKRSANDGLIGFFKGDPLPEIKVPSALSRPLYASWGFNGTRFPNVLEYSQNLLLDCINPLRVTLLMDPQARVHATTGVLPRVYFELSPSEMAGAKGAREAFFQTAPVLGTPATPQIPKPSDDYGEWSWAHRPDVTQWAEDTNFVSASDHGGFSDLYPTISEGWLKLKIDPVQILGIRIRGDAQQPNALVWSVRGAESLKLFNKTEKKVVAEWTKAPLPREFRFRQPVPTNTTFILTAADSTGYQDEKEITINSDFSPKT